MSLGSYDERPEHQTRTQYTSVREALVDAQRVAADLRRQVDGQLFVPASEVEFLSRRLQHFVRFSLDELPISEVSG